MAKVAMSVNIPRAIVTPGNGLYYFLMQDYRYISHRICVMIPLHYTITVRPYLFDSLVYTHFWTADYYRSVGHGKKRN